MHCQSTTFTAELCLNVDFLLGELDRIHSPSLVKYPVLRGSPANSGPVDFASEKSFPLNFVH